MAPGLRLEKITPDNVRAACLLELRPGQEGLVAPVAWSLADAYAAPPDLPWPRLVYDQDELVGFIMAAFDPANHGPEGFYQRLGFRRTAELNQGEVVAELLLAAGPGAGGPSSGG